MAVPTEPYTLCAGGDVALEAKVACVLMPGPFLLESTEVTLMNRCVGAPHTVGVGMASSPGAGGIAGIVARLAALRILAGRAAVLALPGDRRMVQRNPVETLVAAVAERLRFVAAIALDLLALCVEAVRELVIQVVRPAGEIVSLVAFETGAAIAVATGTRFIPVRNHVAVNVPPLRGMQLRQGDTTFMAQLAVVPGAQPVVAIHAACHLGKRDRTAFRVLGRSFVAGQA